MPLVGPCNISNKDEFEPNELPMPVGYDITLRVKDLITERSKYQPLIDEMSAPDGFDRERHRKVITE